MDLKSYTVAIEGFILGCFYKVGATVTLNERQARDFLREKRISPVKADDVKPESAKTSAKATAKKSAPDPKSEAVQGF